MKDRELLNQVAEKLERCEYTPIVTTKEELPIWAMLLDRIYEETLLDRIYEETLKTKER